MNPIRKKKNVSELDAIAARLQKAEQKLDAKQTKLVERSDKKVKLISRRMKRADLKRIESIDVDIIGKFRRSDVFDDPSTYQALIADRLKRNTPYEVVRWKTDYRYDGRSTPKDKATKVRLTAKVKLKDEVLAKVSPPPEPVEKKDELLPLGELQTYAQQIAEQALEKQIGKVVGDVRARLSGELLSRAESRRPLFDAPILVAQYGEATRGDLSVGVLHRAGLAKLEQRLKDRLEGTDYEFVSFEHRKDGDGRSSIWAKVASRGQQVTWSALLKLGHDHHAG